MAAVAARRAELGTSAQELRAAQAAESCAQVQALLEAVVVRRLVEPGATVVPGAALLRLVAPDSARPSVGLVLARVRWQVQTCSGW